MGIFNQIIYSRGVRPILFKNKQILITGASSGIGREFAKALIEEGASKVLLIARREERLRALQEELGERCEFLTADLTNQEDYKRIEEWLSGREIDVLVNNAGVGSFGPHFFGKFEEDLAVVRLNVEGTIRMAALCRESLIKNKGALISLSSIAAFSPLPFMATYAASKTFNYFHSMALHHELKEHGVSVHIFCPGPTATEFYGVAKVKGTWTAAKRDNAAAVVRECIKNCKKGRRVTVPGVKWKAVCLLMKILPYYLSAKIGYNVLLPAWKEHSKK